MWNFTKFAFGCTRIVVYIVKYYCKYSLKHYFIVNHFRSSTEDDSDKIDIDKEKQSKAKDLDKGSDDSNSSKPVEPEDQQEENRKKLTDLANTLLKEWSSLKEVYRIPKKERIEQMKEHEREAGKLSISVYFRSLKKIML